MGVHHHVPFAIVLTIVSLLLIREIIKGKPDHENRGLVLPENEHTETRDDDHVREFGGEGGGECFESFISGACFVDCCFLFLCFLCRVFLFLYRSCACSVECFFFFCSCACSVECFSYFVRVLALSSVFFILFVCLLCRVFF